MYFLSRRFITLWLKSAFEHLLTKSCTIHRPLVNLKQTSNMKFQNSKKPDSAYAQLQSQFCQPSLNPEGFRREPCLSSSPLLHLKKVADDVVAHGECCFRETQVLTCQTQRAALQMHMGILKKTFQTTWRKVFLQFLKIQSR